MCVAAHVDVNVSGVNLRYLVCIIVMCVSPCCVCVVCVDVVVSMLLCMLILLYLLILLCVLTNVGTSSQIQLSSAYHHFVFVILLCALTLLCMLMSLCVYILSCDLVSTGRQVKGMGWLRSVGSIKLYVSFCRISSLL